MKCWYTRADAILRRGAEPDIGLSLGRVFWRSEQVHVHTHSISIEQECAIALPEISKANVWSATQLLDAWHDAADVDVG